MTKLVSILQSIPVTSVTKIKHLQSNVTFVFSRIMAILPQDGALQLRPALPSNNVLVLGFLSRVEIYLWM